MTGRAFPANRELRIADCGLRRRNARSIRNPNAEIHPHVCLSLLVLFWSANVAVASSRSAGPLGRGTVPPSRYQSSLVQLPSPVDSTTNRVVTGNVSAGRHLRSNVPYGSPTSFGGPLGSTSLDSFLRYSAVPEELSDGSSADSLFHSPTGTVAKMQAGAGGVFAPGSPRIAGTPMQSHPDQPADTTPTPDFTGSGTSAGYRSISNAFLAPASYPRTSPDDGTPRWSKTPEEMRRLIVGEAGDPSAERRPLVQAGQVMTSDEYRRQLDQLQQDFDRVRAGASSFDFEQNLRTGPAELGQPQGTGALDAGLPVPSAEALRSIIQPRAPRESSTSTGTELPPPSGIVQGERLSERTLSSQDPSWREFAVLSPALDGAGTGQSAGGSPDLTQWSRSGQPTGAAPGTPLESRFRSYDRPAAFAPALELSARQKSRIDAVFRPQTIGTTADTIGPGPLEPKRQEGGDWPAVPDIGATSRLPDPPAAVFERSVRDAAALGPVADNGVAGAASPLPASPPAATLPDPTPQTPERVALPDAAVHNDIQPGTVNVTPRAPAAPTDAVEPPALGHPSPQPATLDAASQQKFDLYLRSAQSSLAQGQYGRAAESFGLAGALNPRDARPQLGRSHALLAAGDYLNSATCLARAIELDPRSVLKKVDLIGALGGPDAFVQRVTDLEQRAHTGEAPGLQLLLAHIYQQMDRRQEALALLQAAREALPSSRPLHILQAAIESVAPG
jgi:hypothetical protein